VRLGIDRDENRILDGDEPRPSLRIYASGANAIVADQIHRAFSWNVRSVFRQQTGRPTQTRAA
jgi:hypothetical protein